MASFANVVPGLTMGSRPNPPSAGIENLVNKFGKAVYSFALSLVRDRNEAEDITQEVFLKAMESLPPILEKPKSWLFKLAHHEFINRERSPRNRATIVVSPDHFLDPHPNPAASAETADLDRLCQDAVQKLPEKYRVVFVLRLSEKDLSFLEIAKILEITEETARYRMFEARKKLVKMLAPSLGD